MPRQKQRKAPPDRAGEVIADRFVIEKSIARGGMGCVYLASQLNLQRKAAIKILPPHPDHDKEFRERFLLEASTCARLAHPHIVTVYDYGETSSGELYMAMEHLQGEPLSKIIKQSGHLSPERTCEIAIQACSALRAAHKVGIVHRDLKPSNLMVGRADDEVSDFVKVLDFGLAKRFNKDAEQEAVTESGVWLGSLHYMAPEQIRCEDVDPRTDVYSLGVLMYHMAAGKVPFPGAKVLDVLQKHLGEKPPRLKDVLPKGTYAPELEVIIHRCLEKEPADRYPNVGAVSVELKAALRMIGGATSGIENSTLFSEPTEVGTSIDASILLSKLKAKERMLVVDDDGDGDDFFQFWLGPPSTVSRRVAVALGVMMIGFLGSVLVLRATQVESQAPNLPAKAVTTSSQEPSTANSATTDRSSAIEAPTNTAANQAAIDTPTVDAPAVDAPAVDGSEGAAGLEAPVDIAYAADSAVTADSTQRGDRLDAQDEAAAPSTGHNPSVDEPAVRPPSAQQKASNERTSSLPALGEPPPVKRAAALPIVDKAERAPKSSRPTKPGKSGRLIVVDTLDEAGPDEIEIPVMD